MGLNVHTCLILKKTISLKAFPLNYTDVGPHLKSSFWWQLDDELKEKDSIIILIIIIRTAVNKLCLLICEK